MPSGFEIHVIDRDDKRRAAVLRALGSPYGHAEFDAALEEFCRSKPERALILAADDDSGAALSILNRGQAAGSAVPVIVYAEHPRTDQVASAMAAGALYYLEHPFSLDRIEQALQGRGPMLEKLRAARRRQDAVARLAKLTKREREIFEQFVSGLSSKAIGELLNISRKTVEIHRGRIMRKLDARSVPHAVHIAYHAGLGARILELSRPRDQN